MDLDLHIKGWRLRQVGLSEKLNYVRAGRRVGLSIYIHSIDCSCAQTCTRSYFLPWNYLFTILPSLALENTLYFLKRSFDNVVV